MSRLFRGVFILVFLATLDLSVVGIAASFRKDRKAAPRVSVCELVATPAKYAQKVVSVRAFIFSDLRHGAALVDQSCESVGIAFDSTARTGRPTTLIKDKSYHTFESLFLRIRELNESKQRIYGTFDGIFEVHPDEFPSRILVLHRVRNLHVGQQDDPRLSSQDSRPQALD